MNYRTYALIFTLALSGCSQDDVNEISKVAVEKQEVVLVSVDGEVIDDEDLDSAIVNTLGEYAAFQLEQAGRQKVLKSLVVSKAMAITQTKKLNEDEINAIERKVKAYREKLLVKRYLKDNVVPIPVTKAMVEEYYQQNPELFGGKIISTFEVVKGLTKVEGPARNKIITVITDLAKNKDWKATVAKLKNSGLQLEYSKGALSGKMLKSDIDSILKNLSLNQASNVHYIDGLPLIARVINKKTIAPKPLSLVSDDIKKSLAPIQLKKAVRNVSDEILKKVSVVYAETTL